jgi:F0F1-type ATP synthase delta subunit
MTPQDLLDKILERTFTKPQALSRLRVLKDLALTHLFEETSKKEAEEKPVQSPAQETVWIVSLGTDIYKNFTRDNVYQIFNEVETEIKKINPVIVYLPFELPDTELTQLGQYFRRDYGKRLLIDVKLDPSLIAGTALVWNGIYRDYSLRKKINDNRQLIIKTLKESIVKPKLQS